MTAKGTAPTPLAPSRTHPARTSTRRAPRLRPGTAAKERGRARASLRACAGRSRGDAPDPPRRPPRNADGPAPPEAVRRLVAYSRLRARAGRLRVTSITRQAGQVHLRFAEDAAVDPERLLDFVRRMRGARLSPGRVLSLPSPAGDAVLAELMSWLDEFERERAA